MNKNFNERYKMSHSQMDISRVLIKSPSSKREVESLVELNRKWQSKNLIDHSGGFLSGGEFGFEIFTQLSNKKEMVVGIAKNKVVSYYNVNSLIKDGAVGEHRVKVENLKEKGCIAAKARVAVGVQVVVDTEYQGTQLAKLMLNKLISNTIDRYDYYYTTVSKENEKSIKAHKKGGWLITDEDSKQYHLLYDLKKHIGIPV